MIRSEASIKHFSLSSKGVINIKEFKLTCGAIVFLDDEDYERIPKSGWYLTPIKRPDCNTDRKTRYATHDIYGRMHRWILGIKDDKIVIDHIDGNGLNNQKSNLRLVSCGINKKNQKTVASNKFNFNGISYEKSSLRIRVRWSEGIPEYKYNGYRAKQKSKSFNLKKYNNDYNLALKDAILFRIEKMRENEYLIDERSTTIEKILLQEKYPNMSEILGINLVKIFE